MLLYCHFRPCHGPSPQCCRIFSQSNCLVWYFDGTLILLMALFCVRHIFQHGTKHEFLNGSPVNSSCHWNGQTTTRNSGFGIMQTSKVRYVPVVAHTSQSCLPEVIYIYLSFLPFFVPQTSDNLVTSVHSWYIVGGSSLQLCSGSI